MPRQKNKPTLILPTFAALLAGAWICGCGHPAASLSSSQLDQEAAGTKQFKQQLSGMTPEQMAEKFRSDPQRARDMLMPPGMGNPRNRLEPHK